MSPEEARLLALERRVYRLPVLDLERRAVALEQGLAQSWSWGVGYQTPTTGGPPVIDPTKAYFRVRCWTEGGGLAVGCPVTITDSTAGTTVATGVAGSDGSFWSPGLSPGPSNTHIYTIVTSAGGKTNVNFGLTAPPGGGFVTAIHALILATGTTTKLADPTFGNVTLGWDGTDSWASSGFTANVAACAFSGCAAATAVPITYKVKNQFAEDNDGTRHATLTLTFKGNTFTGCPQASGTTNFGVTNAISQTGSWIAAGTIAAQFRVASGSNLYCNTTPLLTFTQP
jgi:hypothetical protein